MEKVAVRELRLMILSLCIWLVIGASCQKGNVINTPYPTSGSAEIQSTPLPTSIVPAPSVPATTAPSEVPDSTDLYESLEEEILSYLNDGSEPDALEAFIQIAEEALRAREETIYPTMAPPVVDIVDLTGDGIQEVIVLLHWDANFSNVDLDRILLVLAHEGGDYIALARIHAQDLVQRPYDMELARIEDVNQDGINEIILTLHDYQGPTGTNMLYVTFVLGWRDSDFQHLILSGDEFLQPYLNGASALNVEAQLMDEDGDGRIEIVVRHAGLYQGGSTRYYQIETGPQRGATQIWTWDGSAFSLATEFDSPEYRFQAMHDADDATLAGDYELAMELYLRVIYDNDLLGWAGPTQQMFDENELILEERYRLSAYSAYRIMLLHILWGNVAQAEEDLDTLHTYYPADSLQYPFTEMANIFWETYQASGEIEAACKKTSEYAASATYSSPATLFGEGNPIDLLGISYYGWLNRDYSPKDICPFQ